MNFNFCPECGTKGSVIATTITKYVCSNCAMTYWNNPKATVVMIFVKDQQLLFSKRANEPHKGKYDFPGGFVDYGEDPINAAIREVTEETSVVLQPEDLELFTTYAGEYMPGITTVDLVYLVRNWQGDFVASDDVAALEWQPIDFMNSPGFVPHYQGYDKIIQNYLDKTK